LLENKSCGFFEVVEDKTSNNLVFLELSKKFVCYVHDFTEFNAELLLHLHHFKAFVVDAELDYLKKLLTLRHSGKRYPPLKLFQIGHFRVPVRLHALKL